MKQQSFQEAIDASKRRCELELQKAQEKAEKVYNKLSSRAIAGHEKRVAKIIERQEKMSPAGVAFAQAHDVSAYRDLVRSQIYALHLQTGHEVNGLYNLAYGKLFMETGFHPKAHIKNKSESQLEVVVQVGLLGNLLKIVNGMLEDLRLAAAGPGPVIYGETLPQPMLPGMA